MPDLEPYHNVFHITDDNTQTRQFNDLELHTIELRKFIPKSNKDKLSEIVEKRVHEPLDKWCTFFARSKLLKKDSLPPQLDYEELRRALEVLEEINMNQEERRVYEARRDWISNERVGRQEAFKKGEAKGKMEKSVEMAKILLAKGVSMEIVCESSGLSKHDLEALEDDTNNDKSAKKRAKLTLAVNDKVISSYN